MTCKTQRVTIKEERLPFSETVLASPSSIFSQGLIQFCFYSLCSSKVLVARCDSKEGLYCFSCCLFYSLHFNRAKEKTLCGIAPICFVNTLVRSCKPGYKASAVIFATVLSHLAESYTLHCWSPSLISDQLCNCYKPDHTSHFLQLL